MTNLKSIPMIAGVLGLVTLLLLLIFYPIPVFIYGFGVGLGLALTNFIFLTKAIVKFVDQNYKRKSLLALLFFTKFLIIVGILYLTFKVFKWDVMGFALGFFCLMPAILLHQLMNKSS